MVGGDVQERALHVDRRVVHENVDTSELSDAALYDHFTVIWAAHVGLHPGYTPVSAT
jgi:hypothetical protein